MTTQSVPKSSVLPKSLTIIATILSIPFLTFYWMQLRWAIPQAIEAEYPSWLSPLSGILGFPFWVFAGTVFGNPYTHILATLASLTAVVAALVKGRPRRLLRVWLVLLMCAIIAFPFLLRYRPSLVAASGYRMQWVTDPGFLGGVVKTSQDYVEKTPCEYELLGWSADNRLYYQAICDAEAQIWQYSPTESGSHVQVSSDLPDLSISTVPRSTALRMVQGRYGSTEEWMEVIHLIGEGVVSPDGQFVAMVTRYVYGTQDVILLTEAE